MAAEVGDETDEAAEEAAMTALLAVFEIRSKAALIDHCKSVTVRGTDLSHLIMAADAEAISLRHIPIFRHHHPAHLHLTENDLGAIGSAKVGTMESPARKAVGKIFQMMEERRMFCAHMFWPPHLSGHWHLFYFDQRDISAEESHWEHGSHIHLMNMLTHPQLDPNDLLDQLRSTERPRLGGSLHIRYAHGR